MNNPSPKTNVASADRSFVPSGPDRIAGVVRLLTRVSSMDQAINGYGLAAQVSESKAYCKALGWPEPVVYEDAGVSGRLDTRPALERMFRELKPGDVVIVHSLSRLSRAGVSKIAVAVDRIKSCGARFISIKEAIDTHGNSGVLVLAIFAAFAQAELEQTRERTMSGRLEKARQGLWPSGAIAYGLVVRDGRIEPDPERAEYARLIFELAPSRSIEGLMDELEARGVPAPPRAQRWLASTISQMLRNRVYIGELRWGEKVHPNNPETWLPIPCPALITPVQFEAAQRKHRERPRAKPEFWPLTKHLRCAVCGGPMVGAGAGTGESKRRTYRCAVAMKSRAYRRAGRTCAMARAFPADNTNIRAAAVLTETLLSPEALALIAAPVTRQSESIALEQIQLRKQLDRLLDAFQAGDLSREQWRERRQRAEMRLTELERPVESVTIPNDLRAALSNVRNLRGLDFAEVLNELHARLEIELNGTLTVAEVRIPVEEIA